MFRLTIVVLAVLIGLSCAQPKIPDTVKVLLPRLPGAIEKVTEIYNKVKEQELKQFDDLSIADVLQNFKDRVKNAQSLVDQTAAALKTATEDFTAALAGLVSKIARQVAKTRVLGGLITAFNDTRAAIMVECEVLKNFTAVAAVALKDAARAKLDLTLKEQRLLISLGPSIILDPSKARATGAEIANLRAQAKVLENLESTLIPAFKELNVKEIAECLFTAKARTIELIFGLKSNFTSLKEIVGRTNFKRRITDITVALLDKAGVELSTDLIEPVFDLALNTVSFAIKAKSIALAPGDVSDLLASVKTALEAITNADVTVHLLDGFINVRINAAALPRINLPAIKDDIKTLIDKFETKVEAAGSMFNQFKTELATITKEAISDAVVEIKKDIEAARATFKEAKAAFEAKFTELVADVGKLKAAIAKEVKEAKEVVVEVLQAKKTQIESFIKDLKAHIEDLKAKIPEIKEEIRKIQDKILEIEAKIKVAAGNVLDELNDQKEILIDALKAKAGELEEIKDLIVSQGAEIIEIVKKLEAEKIELIEKIAKYAAGALDATLDSIQEKVKTKLEKIQEGVKNLAKVVVAGIAEVKATAHEILADGVKLSLEIDFDPAVAKVEVILPAIKALLQAEFGSDRVNVILKAAVGNKRAASDKLLLESQVSPASGSNSSSAATSEPASSSGFPIGAIIGIVVAVVVVVIVVVVVVVVKKNARMEQESVRA